MKALILAMMLLLTGCHHDKIVAPKECPTFNAKLSIQVNEHNNSSATISWDDIGNIDTFLERKKVFNEGVKELNDGLVK